MPDSGINVLFMGKNFLRLLEGLWVTLRISLISVVLSIPLGMTKAQTFLYVIVPQTMRRLIPLTINLTTRMIKTTSLVVLIGITEVLKVGKQIIDANRFDYPTAALWVYGVIFLLYFLACWPISSFAKKLEKRWR